jgi:hypothetical protein
MNDNRQIGILPRYEPEYLPMEVHSADSKWQYCTCKSCQDKRFLLESLPGAKINFDTLRLTGERY